MTPGLTDCRLRARGGVGPRDPLPPSENPFNARWRLGRKRPRAKSAIYKTKRPRGEGGGCSAAENRSSGSRSGPFPRNTCGPAPRRAGSATLRAPGVRGSPESGGALYAAGRRGPAAGRRLVCSPRLDPEARGREGRMGSSLPVAAL